MKKSEIEDLREKSIERLKKDKSDLEMQLMKNKGFLGTQTKSGKSKSLIKGAKSNKKIKRVIATINLILHERKNGQRK